MLLQYKKKFLGTSEKQTEYVQSQICKTNFYEWTHGQRYKKQPLHTKLLKFATISRVKSEYFTFNQRENKRVGMIN